MQFRLPVINVKRDVREIRLIKPERLTLEDVEKESDEEGVGGDQPSTANGPKSPKGDPEERERRTGVVHLQTVPPNFTVTRIRELFSRVGEVGRIYLQVGTP